MNPARRAYRFVRKITSAAPLVAALYLASVLLTVAFAAPAHGSGHDLLIDYKHGKLHLVMTHADGTHHGEELDASHGELLSGHTHDEGHETHLTDSSENIAQSGKRIGNAAMKVQPFARPLGAEAAVKAAPHHLPVNKSIAIKNTIVLLI